MHKLSKSALRNICCKTFDVIKLFITKFRGKTSTKGIGMQNRAQILTDSYIL